MPDDSIANLPETLTFLVPHISHYKLECEPDIFDTLDRIDAETVSQLGYIASKIKSRQLFDVIEGHLKMYPLDKHEGSAWLYFFLGFLDHLDLDFC